MAIARQVLCVCALLSLPHARAEPIRYSVAEEAESGSLVGKLAEDAGLTPAQLSARRARLVWEDGRQHFRLERASGRLVVAARLDREELCAQAATCMLPFELLLSNPLQFFRVEVALEDINDHSPVFPKERVTFKIPETSDLGSRFPLEGARDLDIGSNSIQAYSISPENEYFSVSYGSRSDDDTYLELVLKKALDREEQAEMDFSVIAEDGGSPPRTGTTEVKIVILDVNDNAPIFTQERYIVKILENMPEGSVLVRDNGQPPLSATAALSALLLKDFSDVRLPHSSAATEDQDGSLTTYLIISLVFVSLLFLVSTTLFVARKVCKRKELEAGPVLYGADNLQSGLADAAAAGSLPRAYCYEISLTTGSGNSEFRFLKPIVPSLPPQHCATSQGPDEEQDFPCVPVSTEDMAPDNRGTLTAR